MHADAIEGAFSQVGQIKADSLGGLKHQAAAVTADAEIRIKA